MSLCFHLRNGDHVMLKDNAVVPREVLDDAYAFSIERQLIEVLERLGLRAEYVLDDRHMPTALVLKIPPELKVGGHGDLTEQFTIRGISKEAGASQIVVELALPEIDSRKA